MAREVVIDYKTVEEQKEVVWCDDCGTDCTDHHVYVLEEKCRACAEDSDSGYRYKSIGYAKRKLTELNERSQLSTQNIQFVFSLANIFTLLFAYSVILWVANMLIFQSSGEVVVSGHLFMLFFVSFVVTGFAAAYLHY